MLGRNAWPGCDADHTYSLCECLAPTTRYLRLHLFEKRAFLRMPFEDQALAFNENNVAQAIELFKRGWPFETLWLIAVAKDITRRAAQHAVAVIFYPCPGQIPHFANAVRHDVIQRHVQPILVFTHEIKTVARAVNLSSQFQVVESITMSAVVAMHQAERGASLMWIIFKRQGF